MKVAAKNKIIQATINSGFKIYMRAIVIKTKKICKLNIMNKVYWLGNILFDHYPVVTVGYYLWMLFFIGNAPWVLRVKIMSASFKWFWN
jgi:hypothetical protein